MNKLKLHGYPLVLNSLTWFSLTPLYSNAGTVLFLPAWVCIFSSDRTITQNWKNQAFYRNQIPVLGYGHICARFR